jgi:hypothetical protein
MTIFSFTDILARPLPDRPSGLYAATNVVRVTGEKLAPVLWQNEQWAVTKFGLECRDGTYYIEKTRLLEGLGTEHGWHHHMAEKGWCHMEQFYPAFLMAIGLHFPAAKKANKRASLKANRREAQS